jgi:hypothetical protein
MSRWRERLDEFDEEHRIMLEGGSISQLFLGYPLSFSHPAFIGIIYALMINLTLILPAAYDGYVNSRELDSIIEMWLNESLIIIFICGFLGGASSLMSSIFKRPPVRLEKRRRYIYPLPFIGFLITTIAIAFSISNTIEWIGYSLIILPGPLYLQLSYAPRWRILERIDRDLDPFEGMSMTIYPDNEKEEIIEKKNIEIENAIEELD